MTETNVTIDDIEWLGRWEPVGEGSNFKEELHRELHPEHPLYGRSVEAIGRRADQDDVVFRILDDWPRIAVVHLTWRGAVEPDPRLPATVFFTNAAAFAASCAEEDGG